MGQRGAKKDTGAINMDLDNDETSATSRLSDHYEPNQKRRKLNEDEPQMRDAGVNNIIGR